MTPFVELRVRLAIPFAVVAAVAACSSSTASPSGPKSPPPTPAIDTLLANGSVPASGGTLTVNKSGDPLNGLTLTVSSGSFPSALTLTIGSSSNKSMPTANGIVPISPVVHVSGAGAAYANGAISVSIPASVPDSMFPLVVAYDSATKAMEPLTTVGYDKSHVIAITSHLSNANLSPAPNASMVASARPRAAEDPATMDFTFVVYQIPSSELEKDWDTGFKPGTNDWDLLPIATEVSQGVLLLSDATTAMWYFNSSASAIPLYDRFTIIKHASFTNRIGYHWLSVLEGQVDQHYNAYSAPALRLIAGNQGVLKDQIQFDQIRGSFAIAALNGGRPLPVLVDVYNKDAQSGLRHYFLVAYKAVGDKVYVSDPLSPGDATPFIQLPDGQTMTPYVNPTFRPGISFTSPLVTPLGMVMPLSSLSATYALAANGTIGNADFPTSGFYTWSGQLYDTMYVVDSLRIWGQCGACGYGWATPLSPPPSGKVLKGWRFYQLQGGSVTDSSGGLGTSGVLFSTIAAGTQETFGVPFFSAKSSNEPVADNMIFANWLDYHRFTITRLKTTIAPASPEALPNAPLSLSVSSVSPSLLPANIAYRWDFGDNTAKVTVQNNANAQHTYTDTGAYNAIVEILDNRNAQVIARGNTTVSVANKPQLWQIQSLTYLYTLIDGNTVSHVGDSTAGKGLLLTIQPGTTPTLVALDGPPLPTPAGNYPVLGFYFASPDSAKHFAQVPGQPLAIATPVAGFDVVAYSDVGGPTSGTITGKIQSTTNPGGTPATPYGYSIQLTKNGSALSGYIKVQGVGNYKGATHTLMTIDSVTAVRVP